MKKLTALLLAALMLLALLPGCAGEQEDKGIFHELTGFERDETIVTIEGQEVPTEMYLYWVLYAADYALSRYGAVLKNEDGTVNWEKEMGSDMTLKEAVLEEALNSAKMYMIVEKWAEDYGVTLSEESEQAIDEEQAAIAEQMGGEEAFLKYLEQRGITPETNRRMSRVFYLYANMLSLTKEEGSPLYIEDDVLYQYDGITEDTVLADHILLSYPEDEAERPEVLAVMEDVRATIVSDEEPEEAFNFVADNYSEDPGRAGNPNGYLVTADAPLVQSFKDAALSLEEYEVSEVIESEYGYHILMRKPLRDYVADAYLADLITVAMQNAEVKWSTDYMKFDLIAFYDGYQAYAQEQAAAEQEQSEEAAGDTAE